MKYKVATFIIGCMYNLVVATNRNLIEVFERKSTLTLNSLLVTVLRTCQLDTKSIMLYDDSLLLPNFTFIAEVLPQISVSLFSRSNELWRRRQPCIQDPKMDGVLFVFDRNTAWDSIEQFLQKWQYNKDSIIYIFPKPLENCASYEKALEMMMRFYVSRAYFFCMRNYQTIDVYTHDPYGDTRPQQWEKIEQQLLWDRKWTTYKRSFNKDSEIHHLCTGFDFQRTDPNQRKFLVFGIRRNQLLDTENLVDKSRVYKHRIGEHLKIYRFTVEPLETLLKIRFKYYILDEKIDAKILNDRTYIGTGVDGLFIPTVASVLGRWNFFFPLRYNTLKIISHSRGLMTPLEKIAQFYGKWTLSSLIVIMIIAFIVMWFSTRNLNATAFNVLRLLINGEIITPMDTWALKLFFSMIFLYFLVIHATFSGHLAKFLTKVKYWPGIDTIEQLKDPSIEKIYAFRYRYDTTEEFDDLRQKTIQVYNSRQCHLITSHPRYVAIGPITQFLDMNEDYITTGKTTFYTSKNTFGSHFSSYLYKPGLPLREKFNWAIMVVFESGTVKLDEISKHVMLERRRKIHAVRTHVYYRPISISDIRFVLIFLIVGNCVGLVCFFFEITYKNCRSKLTTNVFNKITCRRK